MMKTYLLPIAALIVTATLIPALFLTPVQAAPQLVFNTTRPINHLEGSLEAQVLFAQSQILPARPREGDVQGC